MDSALLEPPPSGPAGPMLGPDAADRPSSGAPEPTAFERLAGELRAMVAPDDPIGRLLAELAVLAADRHRRSSAVEPRGEVPGLPWCRYHSLAERSLRAALKDLQRHLDRLGKAGARAGSPASPVVADRRPAAVASPTAEAAPTAGAAPSGSAAGQAAAAGEWRRQIALVRSVSEEWPILTRLRLEVEEVASWVADGHPEAEVLARYPELTPAELAACLACDAEGLCGPFDPAAGPYPPGLPVLDRPPDDP